ncbi:hypothetical protein ACEWY4_015416 [Coilia grayii]|uniref:Otogelin-like protein n=1 Tax=Coilia grayii TaxID=363190 RepID=A0ABD1JN16_9TELE
MPAPDVVDLRQTTTSQVTTSYTTEVQPEPETLSTTSRHPERPTTTTAEPIHTPSTTTTTSRATETTSSVPTTRTTTYRPHLEVTSATSQPSTYRTTDWDRPPHPETSSTVVPSLTQRVTATTKAVTPSLSTGESTFVRTSTTHPSPEATTRVAPTDAEPAPITRTMTTTTTERATSRSPTTTTTSPEVAETVRTSSSSPQTTTVSPVTIRPHTDTTRVAPVTGRVEVSATAATAATTTRPASWSAHSTTTSTLATFRPSTPSEERVTTRVPPMTQTPRTTTTLRTTSRVTASTAVPPMSPTVTSSTGTTTSRITESTTTTTTTTTPASSTARIPPSSPGAVSVTSPHTTSTTGTSATTESTTETVEEPTTKTTVTSSKPVVTLTSTVAVPELTTTAEKTSTSEHTSSTSAPSADGRPSPGVTTTRSVPEPEVRTLASSVPVSSAHPTTLSTRGMRTSMSAVGPTSEESSEVPETPSASELPATMTAPATRMCTPPYSEIIDECTKYICVGEQMVLFNKSQHCPYNSSPPNCGLLGFAVLVNGDKCCPKWDCPCRCSVFPDLNVITFDGNSVAIYKAASYVVTQLPNETVSILVQECPVSDTLFVNSRYAKPRFKKYGFEILDTGNMYFIRTPTGLKIQWFHSTGMMVLETDTYNKKLPTMGLCGCCDGNPANDLTLSNGTTVGDSEDPAVFIDSWQVPNTTSYVSESRRREVNCSTSDCSECLAMLNNGTFPRCHDYVPPETFCELWVRDVEYVNNPCVALAAYVASCHKFNICIEWRSPDYCPFLCPESLRYQACLTTCMAQSCPNHEFEYAPEQCSGMTEGCVCPEGTLLHRPYFSLCIPPSKCACTDSFGTPHAVGEVWKASKDGCCMYRCDNDTIVPVEYNCTEVPQPLCHKTGEMIISLADDKSCCPQKVCECDPDLCETVVPSCREDQTLIPTKAEGSCCLAFICKMVPKCEEGELLTVDANSTDRCCPVYHCVCEPYRCAEFSCPVGMAIATDSLPGRCCPQRTCVRDAVCVDGQKAVMRPGQTLVEQSDPGVCLATHCSHTLDPLTGYYAIRTTTTNCSAQCHPNQIYVPPKDPSTCCGVCKNISCLYTNDNGTVILHKPGKSWVSDCMRYECTDTESGPTLVSYSYSCPPFNETECMKVNIVSCDGKCPSASIYNYNINTYARFCKCCREMGLQRRTVQLFCSSNSTWVNYSIQEPTDCSCQWS